ncbi:peptidoglycan DD-metalloendopeptidase family protein [Leptolyngbya sp. GGD]|uniref:peptidoglycan DD-metalloendopeptidase family protein n=1 Tax=Leptolyngbya sp. GGD TaxID=2997907 RepID=UPI00227BFC28|nr:peptidoglycan DD-metalloendopeptidase family protein [Leptolyngbya sp. GGD]MCY6494264.1 peptidoglycan DD-metalloendopeptidase family protein [Leptolyngbya sp. GGD]
MKIQRFFAQAVSVAVMLAIGSMGFDSAAMASSWKMPWRAGQSYGINGSWHFDGFLKTTTAFDVAMPAGTEVLAPIESTVIYQCAARGGDNHRSILLQASTGQRYTLVHVKTTDIFVGKRYRQGDVIGRIAGDRVNDASCAISTGPHLHFGLPSQSFSVDGQQFTLYAIPSRLSSTNGSIVAPSPAPSTGVYTVNFSAISAPTGVNVRSAPSTTAPIVGRIAPNQHINFDAWTFGQVVNDHWINTPDARWYRIAGTNNWVASAVVNGNAPGSRPMP